MLDGPGGRDVFAEAVAQAVDLLRKAYYGYDYEPETVHEEPPGPEVTTTKPPRRAAKRAAS